MVGNMRNSKRPTVEEMFEQARAVQRMARLIGCCVLLLLAFAGTVLVIEWLR